MQKYGFVYIWFDRKHKRYYVGCRWGHENDGYICSSSWMKQAYKKRPYDFKRRILSRIYESRQMLIDEEYRYLSMIKNEELGKRYYNLTNHRNGHWTASDNKRFTIGEKISASHKANPNWASWSKGKINSEETKAKIAASVKALGPRKDISETLKKRWQDPEYRAMQIAKKIGKKQSQKHIDARMNTMKEKGNRGGTFQKGLIPWNKGKKINIPMLWWNNGIKNTRSTICPGKEWSSGKLKVNIVN